MPKLPMLALDPAHLTTGELQRYLQYAIAPRPICLASTINKEGQVNLSPFSFFNLFSTRPPICIFSPARRVRDNTVKHSLENVLEVPEVVINMVSYAMVQQTSLASTEYPKAVNEFEKAGFTMEPSLAVRPPRVGEAPVQLECLVTEVKALGEGPGAGNLVFAEVIRLHLHASILDTTGMIDQAKIDLVARLGDNWYSRVTPDSLFRVNKPLKSKGVGVDALPLSARRSTVLTGNDLGLLGNMEVLPDEETLQALRADPANHHLLEQPELLHQKVKMLLEAREMAQALRYLFLKE